MTTEQKFSPRKYPPQNETGTESGHVFLTGKPLHHKFHFEKHYNESIGRYCTECYRYIIIITLSLKLQIDKSSLCSEAVMTGKILLNFYSNTVFTHFHFVYLSFLLEPEALNIIKNRCDLAGGPNL